MWRTITKHAGMHACAALLRSCHSNLCTRSDTTLQHQSTVPVLQDVPRRSDMAVGN